ncbi:GGDEF domain-containing protein [Vibrio sp. F74]|uniref:GGDEF domain-containing protein n=1 Tax=Vibrio sp. F74 TaxID=700020 RepID=UPI0035F5F412
MKIERSTKKAHLYSGTAKLLLSIFAIIILIANIYILSETKKLVASFSSQQNQATWFLFQLNKELLELASNASHLGDGDNHLPSVILKYDLAWSRFDLLLTSKESDDFMALTGTRPFFTDLFDEYKKIEPLLEAIDETKSENPIEFVNETTKIHKQLVDYINRNFRVASPLYLERRNQVNNLEQMQTALLLLLVVCISIIGLIYSRELKYSRCLALTDTLTSLPNRLALFNVVDELNNENKSFNLFLLDLNGFKQINDKYGHQVGDNALIEVANRLNLNRSMKSYPFRIGGDEFAVVVPEEFLSSGDDFCKVLESIFHHPFKHEDTHYELSTSIGFANYPNDSIHIDELIRHADQRMYQMKFTHREATTDS